MKTPRLLSLVAAAAPALLAVYTYFYSDALTSVNLTYWTQNGTVSATSSGLTATSTTGGSLVYRLGAPGDATLYEVRTTLKLAATGGTYYHLLRASSDALASSSDQGTFYSVELRNPTFESTNRTCSATLGVYKVVSGVRTQLGSNAAVPCWDGVTLRSIVTGGSHILAFLDNVNYFDIQDTSIASGQPGIGAHETPTGNTISGVKLGPHDGTAPGAVDSQTFASAAFPASVQMQWQPPADDTDGIGVYHYDVYRDGVLAGSPATAEFDDETVGASETHTYTIYAVDYHLNASATACTVSVTTPPAGSVNPRRVGVRPTGSYWGGAGEQIDTLSGNLNFTLPLLKAVGRGSTSLAFALNYNSQLWRQDPAGVWKLGRDVGYGFGWRLMAGSIVPYWQNATTIHHYVFTDSTGAEYRLDVNTNGVWTSREGLYLSYVAADRRLYFPDGTYWFMGAVSAGTEQDAGTRYPTRVQDPNGNYIVVKYANGVNCPWADSSARVEGITDVRANLYSTSYIYTFTYTSDTLPHLSSITNRVGTGEKYTFSYSSDQALYAPFSPNTQFGTTRLLQSVIVNDLGVGHSFSYTDQGSELSQVTFPYGGSVAWTYAAYTLLGTRIHREVQYRDLTASSGATATRHAIYRDSGDTDRTVHIGAWIEDSGASRMKVYSFQTGTGNTLLEGLQTSYQELPGIYQTPATRQQDFTWTQDSAQNPYVSSVLTTLDPGTTYAKQSKTEQTVNTRGNVTQTKLYNYGNLTTAARTYNNTYLTESWATSRYMYNRLLTSSVTNGSQTTTLVTNTWGGSHSGTLTNNASMAMHDAFYDTTQLYRGNLIARVTPGSGADYNYDIGGNVVATSDSMGLSVSITPSATTGYSAPGVVTPNSNTDLSTSFAYTTFLGIASVTSPNGVVGAFTYDTLARPSQTTSALRAVTNYTYVNGPPATVTSVTNNHWERTTKDGLGRTVKVEKGYINAQSTWITASTVDTEYSPCACSPMGRVHRVSQPYAPGGTVYWTTYSYDALGRTTSVALPGGTGTTTYLYQGNTVTVTDPASKWKKYTTDAFGNLTQVTEPDPAGGANHQTYYTYDMFNHLTLVSMTRGSVTQTRIFVYNSNLRLQSQTNPENGTTSFTYNADGTVATKTDAKGQHIEYTYDAYKRVTQVRHYNADGTEDQTQRVNSTYDIDPFTGVASQGSLGRLASIQYGGSSDYTESFSYNAGGLVEQKRQSPIGDVRYSYDNEGHVLALEYPDNYVWDSDQNAYVLTAGLVYTYTYDRMGRPITMNDSRTGGYTWVGSAQYNAAGQMTSMTHGPSNIVETRQYNARAQLTNISITPNFSLTYTYPATANAGRITSVTGPYSGVVNSYTYDSLNRLSTATGTNGNWGLSFSYDGFGNLTAQTATLGTPPQITLPYDQTTNRISDTSYSYDANGNLTAMPGYTMSYDIENRMVGLNGLNVQYFYNPSNQRVRMVDASGTWQYYLYGADGRRLGTYGRQWSMTTLISSDVYFGGKKLQSQGQLVYQDRLGSNVNVAQYFPYGESSGNSFIGGDSFATYTRDSASNFDYAVNRYYSSTINRFLTPDPYRASAGLTDPQSWNRYAYVGNDPVNRYDPRGLDWWDPNTNTLHGDPPAYVEGVAAIDGGRYALPGIVMDMPADSGLVNSGGGGRGGGQSSKGGLSTDPKGTGATAWQYLTSIWGTCQTYFSRDSRYDVSAFQSLLTDGITWLDARNSSVGATTVDSYAHNGDTRTLSQLFTYGASAVVLPGTTYVVVGSNYFTDNTQTQQIAIAIHEALHITLKLDDGELAGWLVNFGFKPSTTFTSSEITDWIVGTADHMSTEGGGCKNP